MGKLLSSAQRLVKKAQEIEAIKEERHSYSNGFQLRTEGMNPMESDDPVFNAAQMLRFVNEDAYLKWTYASETALEVLFNGNVLEDSAMTDEYGLYAKKGDKH